jgi:hypothetical protein
MLAFLFSLVFIAYFSHAENAYPNLVGPVNRPPSPGRRSPSATGLKALRFPLSHQYIEPTSSSDTNIVRDDDLLSKRGWGWKRLEDYRGYMYLIDSKGHVQAKTNVSACPKH